jgi:hypothetical protein
MCSDAFWSKRSFKCFLKGNGNWMQASVCFQQKWHPSFSQSLFRSLPIFRDRGPLMKLCRFNGHTMLLNKGWSSVYFVHWWTLYHSLCRTAPAVLLNYIQVFIRDS